MLVHHRAALRTIAALPIIAALTVAATTPAKAQQASDPPSPDTAPPGALTVSASVSLVSDYRFRGVSQSDEEAAIQGGVTVTHQSGFYAATWASNLAGWGTFGGANIELDLVAGYARPIGNANIDVGLTYYSYPGGSDNTDFFEPYVKLSSQLGPAEGLIGIAYAPEQEALGNFSATPFSRGQSEDNVYIWADLSSGVPNTRFSVRGHLGYSNGNPGLGPNGTSVAPTGEYVDWLLGADYTVGALTFGAAYVDTDIGRAESAYLLPNFASTKDGGPIAGPQVVFSATASF